MTDNDFNVDLHFFKQITSVIEKAMGIYSNLDPWQRADAKADVPKVVLQMFTTLNIYSDATVLSACLWFLSLLFEDHAALFSLCVDLILLKLLVSNLRFLLLKSDS